MAYQKNDPLAKKLIEQGNYLKAKRSTWEDHWQDVADYVLPRRSDVSTTGTEGEKRGQLLFDSIGTTCNELLAGALHGMLTNPTALWFDLTSGNTEIDENDEVRLWFDKVVNRMHSILNNSNFQTEIHETYIDLGCFGTAGLDMEEDDELVIRFNARHIRELFVDENHKGEIDTVFRYFKMKPRQLVEKFGLESVGETIAKKYEANAQEEYEVIHAIYPRDPKATGTDNPKRYKIGSCYVLVCEAAVLRESGFLEFPMAVPRWSKNPGETYGRSPAMKCLPDLKMINEMMKTTIKGAQLAVAPPLMVQNDGVIGKVRLTPFGLTNVHDMTNDPIRPLIANSRIDFGMDMLRDVRDRIREAFYVNQLQLPASTPQMTAAEVNQRTEQSLRLMGPMLGRQHSELLRRLIDRLFGIMSRRKELPIPIPQLLQGKNIDVVYSSLVARAQRVSEIDNIHRSISAVAPFIQIDPTVSDNFDGDQAARYIAKISGLPQKLIRDEEKRDGMRDARDKANKQRIQQEQQAHEADQFSKIAPVAVQASQAGVI